MLSRVVEIGKSAANQHKDTILCVATDDERIADHCSEIKVPYYMTSPSCPTGSDRVLEAARLAEDDHGTEFDFIFSLQGDAPFTPIDAIDQMLAKANEDPSAEVITPVVALRWEELDELRKSKNSTPFSGTTAIINEKHKALWFSKNIIPAIRKEESLRENEFSPVYQHLGLYGYRRDILQRFVKLPQGHYEQLEGLEQLRLLENGISIDTVILNVNAGLAQAGVDSPEDIERAEKLISKYG